MPHQIRNPKARAIVEGLFPATGQKRLDELERLDPELSSLLENMIFGGLYAREVLDQRTRELCALSALVVLGRNAQIRSHILASLNAGATRAEIQEVITQMLVYGGFPATLGGLDVMQQVWRELDGG